MKRPRTVLWLTGVICLLAGFAFGVWVGDSRGLPFTTLRRRWSIGIVTGDSPVTLTGAAAPSNPVLSAADVTDVPARFLADPFMVREGDAWHMFFEVLNDRTGQGDIGLATSPDGREWSYRQIVLDEPFHVSFPCVFKWDGTYYMVPESHLDKSVRLYRADPFPTRWTYVKDLLTGRNFSDPSVFRHGGRWWLFVETNPHADDTLRLYHAGELTGPWVEHPKSPVTRENAQIARPAGRVVTWRGHLVRFAQDCWPRYGTHVRAFEILKLSATDYEERPLGDGPILGPGPARWNGTGMHHVDAHEIAPNRWIACVDAQGYWRLFGLEY